MQHIRSSRPHCLGGNNAINLLWAFLPAHSISNGIQSNHRSSPLNLGCNMFGSTMPSCTSVQCRGLGINHDD